MWCFGSRKERYPVQLFLYDLSGGALNVVSKTLMGTHLEAIWHSGVVVYGKVRNKNFIKNKRSTISPMVLK